MSKFVTDELRPDGALLLGFISSDVGSLFSSQLANAMFRKYKTETGLFLDQSSPLI